MDFLCLRTSKIKLTQEDNIILEEVNIVDFETGLNKNGELYFKFGIKNSDINFLEKLLKISKDDINNYSLLISNIGSFSTYAEDILLSGNVNASQYIMLREVKLKAFVCKNFNINEKHQDSIYYVKFYVKPCNMHTKYVVDSYLLHLHTSDTLKDDAGDIVWSIKTKNLEHLKDIDARNVYMSYYVGDKLIISKAIINNGYFTFRISDGVFGKDGVSSDLEIYTGLR